MLVALWGMAALLEAKEVDSKQQVERRPGPYFRNWVTEYVETEMKKGFLFQIVR